MSNKFNHITLLLALLSTGILSCQKEVSGDFGGAEAAGKLSKAYYWYSGDTTDLPSFMDTIYYNSANLIEKVIRTDHQGQDPESFTFEYTASKKVGKVVNRYNGQGWDHVFYYSPAGRLDSMASFRFDGAVISYIEMVVTFQYAGDHLSKVYSYEYNGGDRLLDDSVTYYRTNNKIDSFAVYHEGMTMGPPDMAVTKWNNSSTVELSSFANIASSGYCLLLSYNPELGITYDRLFQQFANPQEVILRNMMLRQVWSTWGTDETEPVNFHYSYYPSKLVRTIIMEDIVGGSPVPEAFKFEYVK